MKLRIQQKAYALNLDKIENGHYYSEVIVLADSRGQAKQKILSEIDLDDYKLELWGDKMTYLNMPVIRKKEYDEVLHNNEVFTRWVLEQKINQEIENQRIEGFLSDESITHCYIKKNGSFYGWNYCGYTSFSTQAGVYPKEEAVPYCKNLDELKCVPINNSEHNEKILNQIARLKKGLIPN